MSRQTDRTNFRLTGLELRRMCKDKKIEEVFWYEMAKEWEGPEEEDYVWEDDDELEAD